MADKEFLRNLHRDLVKNGKLIEAGWVSLRLMAIPEDAPPIQLDEMRNAFFAGAQHLFSSMITIMDSDSEPTERDLEQMTLIDNELRQFIEDFSKRHSIKLDS